MQLNGEISSPQDGHKLYAPVEDVAERWSVRRTTLVVFVVCLAAWIIVIASILGL